MTSGMHNGDNQPGPRLTSLDGLVGADDTRSRRTRRERLHADEDESDDLSDHELRLKLSDMAGQIYLRAWHRNVAMLTPAESTVIAAVIMGLATSEPALRIYDDVLEGNADTIATLVDTIDKAADAMKRNMEEADRTYHKSEARAWEGTGGDI